MAWCRMNVRHMQPGQYWTLGSSTHPSKDWLCREVQELSDGTVRIIYTMGPAVAGRHRHIRTTERHQYRVPKDTRLWVLE